ncbi:GNAT family N-acetyltransferase [Solitalea lacus]|uniref:GNAT family N-acetyltransferase n=1 Tax=Solitalea lacus TaxID=2911172 RepID=UPI001EDB9144|nr:GNAT family N-acetyltransferase [Solitalea lacus]UKJ06610.1 GNAT family N-acetyltransferase [Solitalea lacus]
MRTYTSDRLVIKELSLTDDAFTFELVNTPGWIRFIGDKNIKSLKDAINYIQKIINSPNINYWVVSLKETCLPIGVVTLIKRDYLDHSDIGFAFLPQYAKNGYAFEAATLVLRDVISNPLHTRILATTLKGNLNSIKLIERLGLKFEKVISVENESLQLYSAEIKDLALSK